MPPKNNTNNKKSVTATKASSSTGKNKATSSTQYIVKPEAEIAYTGDELIDPKLPSPKMVDLMDNLESSFDKTLESIRSKLAEPDLFESFKETIFTLFEMESSINGFASDTFDLGDLKILIQENDLEDSLNCPIDELDK